MPRLKRPERPAYLPKRKQFVRRVSDSNYEFYNSKQWRNHRLVYLMNHPLCVNCEEKQQVEAAKVVDHITPINQGGHKWNYDNLQGLCHACHNQKSGREAHKKENKKGEGG